MWKTHHFYLMFCTCTSHNCTKDRQTKTTRVTTEKELLRDAIDADVNYASMLQMLPLSRKNLDMLLHM